MKAALLILLLGAPVLLAAEATPTKAISTIPEEAALRLENAYYRRSAIAERLQRMQTELVLLQQAIGGLDSEIAGQEATLLGGAPDMRIDLKNRTIVPKEPAP